jgi:hypothetical protein
MPMIDVYASAGTFPDPHTLARNLADSPEGGWGIAGHANTNADIAAAARAALAGQ